MSRMAKRHLGFIPIPALIFIVAVLHVIVKPSLFFEPTWLLPITNTLFVTVVCFVIAYIAIRNYRTSGRIQILLLGCGVLGFGIAAVVAAFLRSVPGAGANLNVTIYNTGALVGAIFHFIAALMLLAGISPEEGSKRKEAWAIFSYIGLTVFIALFTIASIRGVIPPFFIQGVGATALRQEVLGSADILFAFSFVIFMGAYLRNREAFLYWYASALALTSISLTGFFIESAVGSPIGWASRFSQYLGGIYFLIAVVSAVRSAHARRISFDRVLTASLSPAEETFRALAENSPDVIDRFDRELKHIYVNPAGLRLYGKSANLVIGKTIEETGVPEPYRSLWKESIEKVFHTGQPMVVEDYFPTKNGPRFYQSHCVPEFGVDGTVTNVLVVSRDLTDAKLAEQILRQSEERYRSLFNGMTEGFALHEIICDEKDEAHDYRFLEINPAFERLTGLKRENIIGRLVSEVLSDIEPYWVKTYGTTVALTGQPVRFENYSSALNRHYEVFAYCPAPRQFAVLFMDISDRKRAEEALKESEAKYHNLFANMTEEVHFWKLVRDEDGRIKTWKLVDANTPTLTTWGKTLEEIKGRTTDEIFGPGASDHYRHIVQKIMTDGVPFSFEDYFPNLDKYFQFTSVPLGDYFITTGADITGIKKAQQALKEANDELELRVQERTKELQQAYNQLMEETRGREQLESQLRQAQKMEAVGTLAGGIAHDFNNILAAIIGFTEMVIDDVSDNAPVQHKMEQVLKAGFRARELVKQILTFSRKSEGERKQVSLASLVRETHALLRASLPTTIQMPLAITTSDDYVLADPTQIQQILMNLATNAAHAMQDGGQLTIAVSSVTFPPGSLPDSGMEPGSYVKLTVKDTGTGMTEEVRQRIFEPFFTTKEQGKGTGMGLAVVYGVVKSHGGAVTVQSEVGQGSIFAVFLPRAQKPEVNKEEETTFALPTGTERILFVDDEEMLVEMARSLLESLWYHVTVAKHPTDAWNLFLEDPSRFDLVITDQTMPDTTGITLAQKILRVRKKLPIILCTGYSEMVSADKAKEVGICEFVMKPMVKKELAETIRRVLDDRKK